MGRELEGKVAVVTGAASGIGLASTEAMLAAGSCVVMVDREKAALKALCSRHGDAVIPLADSAVAERLDTILELRDLVEQLEAAELPRGFGRD